MDRVDQVDYESTGAVPAIVDSWPGLFNMGKEA